MSNQTFWLFLVGAVGLSLGAARIMAAERIARWQQITLSLAALALIMASIFWI